MKNLKRKNLYRDFKYQAEHQGWVFEDYRMYKKFKHYEVDIEFCIDDFCLGIYDKQTLELLEPKQRCSSLMEAYVLAHLIIQEYENLPHKRNNKTSKDRA